MLNIDIYAEPITYKYVKKYVARALEKMHSYERFNSSDVEIIEALQRIFISDPIITGDSESDTDYILIRHLFMFFIFIFIVNMGFKLAGSAIQMISLFYSMGASLFFTVLFVWLHIETNQTSRIMLTLTWIAFCFSLW